MTFFSQGSHFNGISPSLSLSLGAQGGIVESRASKRAKRASKQASSSEQTDAVLRLLGPGVEIRKAPSSVAPPPPNPPLFHLTSPHLHPSSLFCQDLISPSSRSLGHSAKAHRGPGKPQPQLRQASFTYSFWYVFHRGHLQTVLPLTRHLGTRCK